MYLSILEFLKNYATESIRLFFLPPPPSNNESLLVKLSSRYPNSECNKNWQAN